jgi:hypothetical protein
MEPLPAVARLAESPAVEKIMRNIVRSFIDELVPRWAARRAMQRAAELPQEPAGEIQMPVEVAMPAPYRRQDRGPYRPQPTPSHWRAPNM